MPYLKPEDIEAAKSVDLLTYLRSSDPGNLKRISGENYCTVDHDSLKISNGKWFWFSRGIGGYSALDYLVKVKGYSFLQAAEEVLGRHLETSLPQQEPVRQKERKLLLPELKWPPNNAVRYLKSRGISSEVIEYCISHSMIFETEKYHNVVFVGYDLKGVARYGMMRGTFSDYKGEVAGSDKRFSFSIAETPDAEHVHLFESAIDLMSFATLMEMCGRDWKEDHLLSLAGVFQTKRKDVVPVALAQFLKDHPEVTTLHLHLDNDEVGRGAAVGIIAGLGEKYRVLDEHPAKGKDVNELLQMKVGLKKRKEEIER